MAGDCKNRSDSSGIHWNLLNGGNKIKTSGIKIEYSISDEIEFAQKLSISIRKKLMRQLMELENNLYQEELKKIGRLYSLDTVCEEVRKCGCEHKKSKAVNKKIGNKSELSILFKMYED